MKRPARLLGSRSPGRRTAAGEKMIHNDEELRHGTARRTPPGRVGVPRGTGVAGPAGSTPLLARFRDHVAASRQEERWMDGLYLDMPEEWDDPYRFFWW